MSWMTEYSPVKDENTAYEWGKDAEEEAYLQQQRKQLEDERRKLELKTAQAQVKNRLFTTASAAAKATTPGTPRREATARRPPQPLARSDTPRKNVNALQKGRHMNKRGRVGGCHIVVENSPETTGMVWILRESRVGDERRVRYEVDIPIRNISTNSSQTPD